MAITTITIINCTYSPYLLFINKKDCVQAYYSCDLMCPSYSSCMSYPRNVKLDLIELNAVLFSRANVPTLQDWVQSYQGIYRLSRAQLVINLNIEWPFSLKLQNQ
jgi:hypothetical protein